MWQKSFCSPNFHVLLNISQLLYTQVEVKWLVQTNELWVQECFSSLDTWARQFKLMECLPFVHNLLAYDVATRGISLAHFILILWMSKKGLSIKLLQFCDVEWNLDYTNQYRHEGLYCHVTINYVNFKTRTDYRMPLVTELIVCHKVCMCARFFSSLLEKSKPSVSQMKKESYVEISIVNFQGNKSERWALQDTEIGIK